MKKKGIPVGVESFEKMIKDNLYYVDKTLLIRDIIDDGSDVTVFMRPRRFGKTLAISMLQYFFENLKKEDAHLFDGLHISQAGGSYLKHQNAYPVIKFTFKDIEGIPCTKVQTEEERLQSMIESAKEKFRLQMQEEFSRHDYILASDVVKAEDKLLYERLLTGTASESEFHQSIKLLTRVLHHHCGQKTILLIDEYDVPLEKAHFNGYYDEMVKIVRSLFSQALKTNDHLHFAVITGCLRVSKESIFTGVNNLNMVSITSAAYDEYFGFTEEEAEEMLAYYHLSHKTDEMRQWYNGYLFGETIVYNPWSCIKYLYDMTTSSPAFQFAKSHWGNTSSNAIVKDLIDKAKPDVVAEIEALMAGGTIEKPVFEDIVYSEIQANANNLWNFLFFTGYLKVVSYRKEDKELLATLKIPNSEISYIYRRQIREWFDLKVQDKTRFNVLYEGLLLGEANIIREEITKELQETISYFDGNESFYHGFMAGILTGMPGYRMRSNRETGNGRADLMMRPVDMFKRPIILEFKLSSQVKQLRADAQMALEQIDKMNYEQEVLHEGYENPLKIGISFFRKNCFVVVR